MCSFPQYCPRCGTELHRKSVEGRSRAYCDACERPVYRNAKPCAGVAVVDDSEILLVQRTNPPAVGAWSIPAGFLEVDERPEVAAARELAEETGLSVSEAELELFDTTLVAHEDGRYVLVIIYQTTMAATEGTVVAGSDAADAQFWDPQELIESDESLEPGYEPIIRAALNGSQRVSNS